MKRVRTYNLYAFELQQFTFWVGLLGGSVFGVSVYFFLLVSWEFLALFANILRASSFSLLEHELHFFRFFIAFIAFNHGLSVSLKIWTENLMSSVTRYSRFGSRYYNDHRMLTWSFLSWLVRCASIYLVIFSASGWHLMIDWYGDYKFLFILFMLVLFLQNWTWFRITRNRGKWRLMGYSFLMLLGISTGLSFIEAPVIGSVQKNLEQLDILNNEYHFQTISRNDGEQVRLLSSSEFMALLYTEKKNSHDLALFHYRYRRFIPCELDTFPELVNDWKVQYPIYQRKRIVAYLLIDRRVSLKDAAKLIREIGRAGINRFGFAVDAQTNYSPTNPHYFQYIKKTYSLFKHDGIPSPPILESPFLSIEIQGNGKYGIGKKTFRMKGLREIVYSKLKNGVNFSRSIAISAGNDAKFGDFLLLDELIAETQRKMRNEIAKDLYHKSWDQLTQSESDLVFDLAGINVYHSFIYDDE